jgi:hypothetical protein
VETVFGILWLATIVGSIWGGIVLAMKWVKEPVARVFLALVLMVVFVIAGTTAVISGCVAVSGPVNFH